jgi:hypothetical protein
MPFSRLILLLCRYFVPGLLASVSDSALDVSPVILSDPVVGVACESLPDSGAGAFVRSEAAKVALAQGFALAEEVELFCSV